MQYSQDTGEFETKPKKKKKRKDDWRPNREKRHTTIRQKEKEAVGGSYGTQAGLEGQVGLGSVQERRRTLQVVRTARAKCMDPSWSKQSESWDFARAFGKEVLSFPQDCQAGERELPGKNPG